MGARKSALFLFRILYRNEFRTEYGLLVNHADGIFGAGVDAGFAVDAFFGVHKGVSIHHRDDFGGAGFHAIFASGAFGFVDKCGHFVSSRGSF
jgi:hypothetical protein